MIIPGSANALLLGGDDQYQIQRSLRFNSADSAYLNRTFGTPTDNKKWTMSLWCKRGDLGTWRGLFAAGNTGGVITKAEFYTDDLLYINSWNGSSNFQLLATSQVFRDPSAWLHLIFVYDFANATANNRARIYLNGAEITSFSSRTNPATTDTSYWNNASYSQEIGKSYQTATTTSKYFDGYLTEINFIDGQALTPSSFGETDSATGVWKPKKYTGTYGTNGFYLKFADNSGTTSTTLGKDSSGNGNNWTPNNFSVTAGAGNDSLVDTPTSYGTDTGVGGEVRGNYCTLNPLSFGGTVSEANLRAASAGTDYSILSTIGATGGKFYWELVLNNGTDGDVFGINSISSKSPTETTSLTSAGFWGVVNNGTNNWYENGVAVSKASSVPTITAGQIVQVAVDTVNNKYWIGVNNSWWLSGDPAAGTNPISSNLTASATWLAYSQFRNASSNITYNFGQRPFAYTAPSGYKALCTQNLPTPTIGATSTTQANKYMDISLYTGNGSTQSITNSGSMQPDLVWTKARSAAIAGLIYDSVRGATKYIQTNSTGAEGTGTDSLTSFNSNGFSAGADTSTTGVNQNGTTYVGWQWNAGGSNATNTSGTITSTVRANTTAGFSIVTWTGSGTNYSIGHGLSQAPEFFVVKRRDAVDNWMAFHSSVITPSATNKSYIWLNSTSGVNTNSVGTTFTSSTSSVIGLGTDTTAAGINDRMVGYAFHSVDGYSKVGSYTGNGSADGPFVFTNFRPRYLLVKRTDAIASWMVVDSARDTYNMVTKGLYPNLSDAEGTGDDFDFLSNGFKLRDTGAGNNASGGTYIYAAFAESPFKYSLAR